MVTKDIITVDTNYNSEGVFNGFQIQTMYPGRTKLYATVHTDRTDISSFEHSGDDYIFVTIFGLSNSYKLKIVAKLDNVELQSTIEEFFISNNVYSEIKTDNNICFIDNRVIFAGAGVTDQSIKKKVDSNIFVRVN